VEHIPVISPPFHADGTSCIHDHGDPACPGRAVVYAHCTCVNDHTRLKSVEEVLRYLHDHDGDRSFTLLNMWACLSSL
jgi:hypothetical protein